MVAWPETSYQNIEKFVLASVMTLRKIGCYFLARTIIAKTDQPYRIFTLDIARGMAKWLTEIYEIDASFEPMKALNA